MRYINNKSGFRNNDLLLGIFECCDICNIDGCKNVILVIVCIVYNYKV